MFYFIINFIFFLVVSPLHAETSCSNIAKEAGYTHLVVSPRYHKIQEQIQELFHHLDDCDTLSQPIASTYWCWLTKCTQNDTQALLHEGTNRLPLFLYPIEILDSAPFSLSNMAKPYQEEAHSSNSAAISSYLTSMNSCCLLFDKKPSLSNPLCALVTEEMKNEIQTFMLKSPGLIPDFPIISVDPLYKREFYTSTPITWIAGLSKYSPYSLIYACNHFCFEDMIAFLEVEYPKLTLLLSKPSKLQEGQTLLERVQSRDIRPASSPLTDKELFRRIALFGHELGGPFGPKREIKLNSYSLFLGLLEQVAIDRTYGHIIEWFFLKPKPRTRARFLLEVEKLVHRSCLPQEEVLDSLFFLFDLFNKPVAQSNVIKKIASLSRKALSQPQNRPKYTLKQLVSKYFWEKGDPLHRYGPTTQKLRNAFESLILEQPNSHWAGHFPIWLEQNYHDGVPTVYFTDEDRKHYLGKFEGNKICNSYLNFPSDKIMFVIDEKENIYLAEKNRGNSTTAAYSHATFLSGEAVVSAGKLTVKSDGTIEKIRNHSGHYRPGKEELEVAKKIFAKKGVIIESDPS